jgi:hypothetical protein
MIVRDTIHFRTFQARAQEMGFPSLHAAIVTLYQQQHSLAQIGQRLGCAGNTVRQYLRRWDIPRRPRGGKRQNWQWLVRYQGQTSTIRELSQRLGLSPQHTHWKLRHNRLPGAQRIPWRAA